MDLFPEISLDKGQLPVAPRMSYSYLLSAKLGLGNFWEDMQNRKKLFLNYAAEQGFDPLVANNWLLVSADNFLQFKVSNLST